MCSHFVEALLEQRVVVLQNTFYPFELSKFEAPNIVMTGPMLSRTLIER
jgi:hypothetical protein